MTLSNSPTNVLKIPIHILRQMARIFLNYPDWLMAIEEHEDKIAIRIIALERGT